jgi:Flp pilus assembly protein TadG
VAAARGHRGLAGDISGNVLPMAAVGMLVTAALVGGAVDMSRAYNVDNRLQAACDAGVLAGRRAVGDDGFDDDAEERATTYFHANFNEGEQDAHDTVFNATSEDDGNSVNATASSKVQTRIMRIFGFDEMDLSASCSASMGVGNSDITFVLDNTGSMAWTPDGDETTDEEATRMHALQEAMKGFYGTVATSVAGSNARIRYGFVPYSSTVNVGGLLLAEDSSYVADSMTISTRRPVNWSAVVATWEDPATTVAKPAEDFAKYPDNDATKYSSEDNCKSARPADATTFTTYDTDTTTNETFDATRGTNGQKVTAVGEQQYQRKADYECLYQDTGKQSNRGWYVNRRYLRQDITSKTYEARDPIFVTASGQSFANWLWGPWPVNVGTYKTGNAQVLVEETTKGKTKFNASSTWGGCIQERKTAPASSFSFVSLTDGITPNSALDLDIDTAPTSDNDTKWKPLWPSATYRRGMVAKSLTGTTSSASTGCPFASQLLTEMSEDDFGEYVDDLNATGSTYHDIGLLWGARISSPTGIFASTVTEEPDNSGTVSRHLIFMTDGELAPTATVNSAYGIEAIDRRVTTDGKESSQMTNHRSRYLAICEAIKARGIRLWVIAFGAGVTLSSDLTTCASPSSAFKADDSTQLNQHFQEIAKQVGELRVVQ